MEDGCCLNGHVPSEAKGVTIAGRVVPELAVPLARWSGYQERCGLGNVEFRAGRIKPAQKGARAAVTPQQDALAAHSW